MVSICCNRSIKPQRNCKNINRISKIKFFINKNCWKGISYPSGKDAWKKFEKNNPTNVFNVLHVKKWIFILPTFQKTTQSWNTNYSFNYSKQIKMALSCNKNIIHIIKKKNVETWWWFLFFKLSSFFQNKKQTWIA